MKQLNRKDLFFVSLTLFSLFFGAGNLIFPPFLAQEAGRVAPLAMAGFIITAVGFPVLAVIVVIKTDGLKALASKVHPLFAFVYTLLIYLSIGPMLGIPRAASLPFEMVIVPFVDVKEHSVVLLRLLFTAVFFLLAFRFSIRPSKLVDYLGRFLTPLLLFLLMLVFLRVLRFPFPKVHYVRAPYQDKAFLEGFINGYLTMDTIAALNFGLVIANVLEARGVVEDEVKLGMSLKAGLRAGFLLTLIYLLLGYLGMVSGSLGVESEHGAQTLIAVMTHLYGPWGVVFLAFIFTLACLTTSIGLITSISEYFHQQSGKSYVFWASIFTFFSFVVSNIGLNQILQISVPVLDLLYPMALVLIVLGLFDNGTMPKSRYRLGVLLVGFFSLFKLLDDFFHFDFGLMQAFPLYDKGLAWVLPTCLAVITHKFIFQKKAN